MRTFKKDLPVATERLFRPAQRSGPAPQQTRQPPSLAALNQTRANNHFIRWLCAFAATPLEHAKEAAKAEMSLPPTIASLQIDWQSAFSIDATTTVPVSVGVAF